MTEIKRLNYFTSQFLVEKDFTDEQAYHIRKRRLHNQWLHSWGVAGDGLQVKRKAARSIEIGTGIAIDRNGNEIVLLEPLTLDLSNDTANTTLWVTARFEEVKLPGDHYPNGGPDDYTRLTERTTIELGKAAPAADGSVILLATVTLDASGSIDGIANDVRRRAGIAPGTRVGPPTPAGANTLDVQGAPRTREPKITDPKAVFHPTGLALYVTAESRQDGGGVEFRHSNGSQGIGFGYNTIYATGPYPNQSLTLKGFGTGPVIVKGRAEITGGLAVSTIYPQGGEANIPLKLSSKGTGPLSLTGNATLNGSLEITGDSTLAKSLTVAGSLAVSTISPRPAASDRVDIVQESWKPVGGPGLPAFQNKWVNYGGEWNTAAYFMDSLGVVHLRGLIQNPDLKNTNDVIDSIIFTLPQGYRPQAGSVHLVASGHPTQPERAPPPPARGGVEIGYQGFSPLAIFGRVDVMANGNVVARYGKPPEYFSLEGISFRVK